MQIFIRCDRPLVRAARIFETDHVVEVQMHEDRHGLHVRTRDADRLYLLLNRLIVDEGLTVERVGPADDDVHAVYEYLIGHEGEVR